MGKKVYVHVWLATDILVHNKLLLKNWIGLLTNDIIPIIFPIIVGYYKSWSWVSLCIENYWKILPAREVCVWSPMILSHNKMHTIPRLACRFTWMVWYVSWMILPEITGHDFEHKNQYIQFGKWFAKNTLSSPSTELSDSFSFNNKQYSADLTLVTTIKMVSEGKNNRENVGWVISEKY